MNVDCKKWVGFATKAKEEITEQRKLIEELRTDALEKDTRIDHLQKMNNELSTRLSKAKVDAVAEFKSSKAYTDVLDRNYAAGFEDFRMDGRTHRTGLLSWRPPSAAGQSCCRLRARRAHSGPRPWSPFWRD